MSNHTLEEFRALSMAEQNLVFTQWFDSRFKTEDTSMKPWTPDTDPATIPDDVLKSEWGRRNNAKRKTKGAGPGRPRKTAKPCSWCNTDAAEAAKIHEGPHSTWCPRYTKLHSMKP